MILTSDTHLAAHDAAGVERFVRFLSGPCRDAERLILLGDLFDFWVTPSQAAETGFRAAFEALRSLVAGGVDVGFVEGNRDFAATPELAAVGIRRLSDVGLLESRGRRIVYTHGDLLCTRDVRYQALRRVARRRAARHLLRALPAGWALGLGRGARAGSRLETTRKAYGDMGLDARAVAGLLAARDADALVCGHVHWGQRFRLPVEGRDRDIVVLSAWEKQGSYVRLEADELEFRWFD